MILTAYTLLHTLISLVGIVSGFVVLYGLLTNQSFDCSTSLFLWTTIATSITGFFFPFHGFKPSYVVGGISLVILVLAYRARYSNQMMGAWRGTYVITAVTALYLNFFVLIVQSFLKVPALHTLAPTQTEPSFKIAQLTALVLFIVLGIVAFKNFHVEPVAP